VAPVAFGDKSFVQLPPETWSFRWWGAFFADPSWRRALLTSLEVAVLSAALSVVLGTAAALGLAKAGTRLNAALTALLLGPVVVPVCVLAVAL
jgi:putative spermidine/putrescine transport system permease protein